MGDADGTELLQAARRVLRRDGAFGVTFDSVAAEAGVDVEEVTRRFGDRGVMLHELSIDTMSDTAQLITTAVSRAGSGEEALDALVRAIAGLQQTHLEECRLSFAAGQVLPEMIQNRDPVLHGRYGTIGRSFYDVAEHKLLQDWGDALLPNGVHPRRLAFVAGLLAQGFLNMKGMMEAAGQSLLHSDDDLISVMSQVICSPPRLIRQLTALNAASRELAGMRTEDELLARVPHMLTEALDFDRAQLLIDTPGEGLVPVSVSWGRPEEEQMVAAILAENRVRPAPHFRRAITENRTIHVPSPAEDPEWPKIEGPNAEELMDKLGFLTPIVLTPVRVEGKPIGLILGHTHLRWRPMDPQDISRVEAFAAMVGIALDSVRTLENLESLVDERTRKLRDAQAALVQSEKMASMGQLVAGVAHELNTPVGAVSSGQDSLIKCANKLRELLGDALDPRVDATLRALTDSASIVGSGSQRIDGIVKRLRSFARLDEASLQQTDLHECIDAAIALLEHRLLPTVKLERHYGEMPNIHGDPRKLNQLFANLLANAIDAVGSHGSIGVTSRLDGKTLMVAIADSGAGIAPEHLSKIFDPGFTTKGVGVGAGLGLSIAFRIAEEHGGTIAAESTVGEGTTVTLRLPRRVS